MSYPVRPFQLSTDWHYGVGFPLIQSGVWHGKKGTCEFMFFDTAGAINTCFESYVFSDDWEDPDDVECYPAQQ